ncbi:hypothetical protein Dsin_021627 [Dipteronia sinensis]|uniref:Uncharacterized protein n=1 Tax=Dipteronia sinensis TaxID=43782 RepID=A0AAE0A0W6_9ROSI|nr:hypothetical protein Dsin_021627 [Dipteronia sinensis]
MGRFIFCFRSFHHRGNRERKKEEMREKVPTPPLATARRCCLAAVWSHASRRLVSSVGHCSPVLQSRVYCVFIYTFFLSPLPQS